MVKELHEPAKWYEIAAGLLMSVLAFIGLLTVFYVAATWNN